MFAPILQSQSLKGLSMFFELIDKKTVFSQLNPLNKISISCSFSLTISMFSTFSLSSPLIFLIARSIASLIISNSFSLIRSEISSSAKESIIKSTNSAFFKLEYPLIPKFRHISFNSGTLSDCNK